MPGPKPKIPGIPPEANKYILEIINQAILEAKGAPSRQTLQTQNYFAKFDDIVRAAPQGSAITIFLPAPSVQNQGGTITIYVQNASAPVNVIPKGGLVNGLTSISLTAIGKYVFENDSQNWFTDINQSAGGYGVAVQAGTNVVSVGTVNFSSANGLTFGITGNTLTGSYTVPAVVNSGLLNVTNSAFSVNASQLAFTNTGNVTFNLSTAASGATIGGVVATSLTAINVSAGTTSNNLSAMTFANGSNVSFGLNGSVVTASVASSLTAINVSAGTTSNNLSAVTFGNANGFTFGLNGSVVTGSYTSPTVVNSGLLNVTDSAVSANISRLQISNVNGLTLGLATGASIATLTGSYTVPTVVNSGLLNVSNSVSSVNASRMVFSNANNVSWSLATAGSIATVIAQPFLFVSGASSNNVTALHVANNASASILMTTGASAVTLGVSVAPSSGGSATPPPGLNLTATNQSLEVITGTGADVDYQVSYEDLNSGALTPGSSQGSITTATTTTVQAAPTASTQRTIVFISIVNKDVTSQTITVQKDTGGTNHIVFGPVAILPGAGVFYTSDRGFHVKNADGSEYEAEPQSIVRINSGGSEFARRRINAIGGGGIALAMFDDPTNDEIDLSISVDEADPFTWTNEHIFDEVLTLSNELNPGTATTTASVSGVTLNDQNFDDVFWVRVTQGSNNATYTGIVAPAIQRVLMFSNLNSGGEGTGSAVNRTVLAHENAGSSAANRFRCPGGVDFVIPPGGTVFLLYDATITRWRVVGLTSATQALQESAVGNTSYVSPGTQQYHPSAAKFWVRFNGGGTTIDDQYNVSSITDGGTGESTVNLDDAFSSTNWIVGALAQETANSVAGSVFPNSRGVTVSTAIVRGVNGALAFADPLRWNVWGYGDQ